MESRWFYLFGRGAALPVTPDDQMLAGLTPSPGGDDPPGGPNDPPRGPTYSGRVVPPPHIPRCSPVSDRCPTDTIYASCNQQSPTSSASTLHSLSFSTEDASTIDNSHQDQSEATFITPTPSFRCKSSNIENDECSEDESEATTSAVFITPTPSFRSKSRLSSTIENSGRSEDECVDSLSEQFITPASSFRGKLRAPSNIQYKKGENEATLSAKLLTPTPSFRSKLRLSIEPITVQPTVVVRSTDSETCACVGDIIVEAPRPLQVGFGDASVPVNEHQPNGDSSNLSTAAVDHNEPSTQTQIFCCDLFKIEITNEPHNHDNLDVARRPSAEPIKSEPSSPIQVLEAADLSPLSSSQSSSAERQQKGSKTKRSSCFPF